MPRLSDKQLSAIKKHAPSVARSLNKPMPRATSDGQGDYNPTPGVDRDFEELRRGRKAVVDEMRSMHLNAEKENRGFTNEEQDAWDGLTLFLENLDERIEARSASAHAAVTIGNEARSVYENDQRMAHGAAEIRGGIGSIMRAMVLGAQNEQEERALSEGTNSQGGFTVPVEMHKELIDRVRNRAVAFKAGARIVDMTSEKATIARLETDPVAAWRLENANIAEGDPTFGSVTLQARSLAVLVRVSRELLEDSLNIESALYNALQSALALELDRVALFGTGTAPEPRGVFNAAGIQSYSMGANGAVIANYAPLIQASQLLATQNAEPTAMIMAARTQHTIGGLVDSTGQPLNMPKLLEGYRQLRTNAVPVNQTQGTSNDCSSIVVGDFRQLYIGVRQGLRIEVLRERYADQLQYGFIAHLRADVAVAQPSNFCKIIGIKP